MTRQPYESVEVSTSAPGEIVNSPANGEAFGFRLNDERGNYNGYLIEWRNNPDAWISSSNNVSLSGEV